MTVIKAGSNVDAWCTKCKLILAHTIEAIADGTIKRVQCNTCRGKHQYKSSAPGEASESKSSRAIKAKAPVKNKSKASDFTRLMTGKDALLAKSYKATLRFKKGEVINHTLFGVGVVVDEKDATKIEVLFATGSKTLIHARLP